MECSALVNGQELQLCPQISAAIHAGLIVGTEGILLFDRERKDFVYTKILSRGIQKAIGKKSFVEILEANNTFTILDLNSANVWDKASNPYSSRLSMNVCISKPLELYINFQATPLYLGGDSVQILLCSLRFSAIRACNIIFSDRERHDFWKYDFRQKVFVEIDNYSFSEIQLEMLRLSRMGYGVDEISKILHRSRDSIKLYRKQVFDQLCVSSIEEAIAMCEIHHLL